MTPVALLLLVVVGPAVAKPTHPVPDPYRWDESFTVKEPRLDDEHRGLFNAVFMMEHENTAKHLENAKVKFVDHFHYEEGEFSQTMPAAYVAEHKKKHNDFLSRVGNWDAPTPADELTWAKNWLVQHIKNTDFQYKGHMPYLVPNPYVWDESFYVWYEDLDAAHVKIFDAMRELGHDLTNSAALEKLEFVTRVHFDDEAHYFCNEASPYEHCAEHKAKHDKFFKALHAWTVPVDEAALAWAKNWLVQHIKNSDFGYKHLLRDVYHHDVPDPYVWDKSFEVYELDMDHQHDILFDMIRDTINNPENAEKYEALKAMLQKHFTEEEAKFSAVPELHDYAEKHIAAHNAFLAKAAEHHVPLPCEFTEYIANWLAQHIKNTDFGYKSKLTHQVPDPYVWDESFMVFYKDLDDEHKGLFDCIKDCGDHPGDQAKYDHCKSLLRLHFDNEEGHFCEVPSYDCEGHYLKHYNFMTVFQAASIPLPADVITFGKNWLTQHIKNTDHAYRGKLHLRNHYTVPNPYVWDESFLVNYKFLDDQHVVLFDLARELEAAPGDAAVWNRLLTTYQQHFRDEENMFLEIPDESNADHKLRHDGLVKTIEGATVPIPAELIAFIQNWLAQHIKNTDFKYKGKMPVVHPIPDPYVWDSSFMVDYPQMDAEHIDLFTCLHELESDAGNQPKAAACLEVYESHFRNEEHEFFNSNTYDQEDAYQHKNKHDAFLMTFRHLPSPVPSAWLSYAKNWLTQHIKNTDFKYKGKMPHPVPNPYHWDESFLVHYQQLDDEHKVLFDALQRLKENPDNEDILNYNRDVFRDHFDYEEKQFMPCGELCHAEYHKGRHDYFMKTLTWVKVPVSDDYLAFGTNWLAQHIKNTDFKYKGNLPTTHPVPQPYVWNTDFLVSYKDMDEQHVGLFECLYAVEQNPNDQPILDNCRLLVREHFNKEQERFCENAWKDNRDEAYCVSHTKKHVTFSGLLESIVLPVPADTIAYAQNWLVQHIRNTDFQYKGKLFHEVPEPYVWESSFSVDYPDMDNEHDNLFAAIADLAANPADDAKLEHLKTVLHGHFSHEESRFSLIPEYDAGSHKMKHYKYITIVNNLHVPVNCATIKYAKTWLAQHIKNTDFQYKTRFVD